MLTYKPGDSWSVQFTTSNSSGAAVNADSTPTVTVYRNGTSDNSNWGLSAVSNPATGQYRITGTVYASALPGDLIEVKVAATIASVSAIAIIERFRLVPYFDGTASAGGSNTITLASGSSTTDDIYNGRKITIVGGAGIGESALITAYVGSSKVATVDRTWTTQPDSTSQYYIGEIANALLSTAQQDSLVNEFLDLANTVESGETIRQTLRLLRAVLVGVSTESSGTIVFKRRDGTTTALTVVHDNIGSRSSSTPGTV